MYNHLFFYIEHKRYDFQTNNQMISLTNHMYNSQHSFRSPFELKKYSLANIEKQSVELTNVTSM